MLSKILALRSAALIASYLISCNPSIAEPINSRPISKFTIGEIYFFGTDIANFAEIKKAIPVHVGEEHSSIEVAKMKREISNAVNKTLGRSATDVALVNCGNRMWNIYIGLPGKSVIGIAYNPLPKSDAKLLPRAIELNRAFGLALTKSLNEKGGSREDISRGFSMSADPELQAIELQIRGWAIDNDELTRQVLKNAADSNERAIAAQFLGMEDPSSSQIKALVVAANDADSGVRNNATRALACIAGSKTPLSGQVPRGQFIKLLNSGTWLDRNKGMFVVATLAAKDPHLTDRVREHAFQSLCEMAHWDTPHGASSRHMLAEIAGVKNSDRTDADLDKLVLSAQKKYRSAFLQDVFDQDQSDWGRTKARECYQKLLAAQPYFEGTKEDAERQYSLSFESLHLGQTEALDNKNPEKALENFRKSLQHIEVSIKEWQSQNEPQMVASKTEWANYVRATIAYLENDNEKLMALKDKCGSDNKTVARLITGLEKFHKPDYSRDYGGGNDSDLPFEQLKQIFFPLEHEQNMQTASDCYKSLTETESRYSAPPLNQVYYHWLCQSAFFVGVDYLKQNKNSEALKYFEKSLTAANQECKIEEGRKNSYGLRRANQTADYVRAHVAYAKNDVDQLQEVVGKCGARNDIVDSLADGLMTYDSPNYSRDTRRQN